MVFSTSLPSGWGWSDQSEDDWEEDQAVEETKWYGEQENLKDDDDDEHDIDDDDEDLEEGDEDVGVGEAAESEREEGRETPVEHCWTWFEFDFQLVWFSISWTLLDLVWVWPIFKCKFLKIILF